MRVKRIALLIPNTDSILETDLQRALPEHWVVHTARMQLDEVGEAAERRMVDKALPEAIHSLQGIAPFDCAVFGCTSASAVYGMDGMHQIEKDLSKHFGCPAVSALGAVLRSIGRLDHPSVGVLTPYTDEVTAFFVRTMRDFGIKTPYYAGLGLSNDPWIAACEPDEIFDFAREHRRRLQESCDIAFFSCTNLRAFEHLERLRELIGLPVITSNSSIIDWIISGDN